MGSCHSEYIDDEPSPIEIAMERYYSNEKIDWDSIFMRYRFSTNDIIAHSDDIDWTALCRYHPLSLNFIKDNYENIDFSALSKSRYLNDDVVHAYIEKLIFIRVVMSKSISQLYAEELLLGSKISYMIPLLKHYRFRDRLLMQLDPKSLNPDVFYAMVRYQNMGEYCLMYFKDYVDWHVVCRYQFITCSFVLENLERIKWKSLSRNRCLSCGVVIRFRHLLSNTREVRDALGGSTCEVLNNRHMATI